MGPKASDSYWSPLSETSKKSISEKLSWRSPLPKLLGLKVQPNPKPSGVCGKNQNWTELGFFPQRELCSNFQLMLKNELCKYIYISKHQFILNFTKGWNGWFPEHPTCNPKVGSWSISAFSSMTYLKTHSLQLPIAHRVWKIEEPVPCRAGPGVLRYQDHDEWMTVRDFRFWFILIWSHTRHYRWPWTISQHCRESKKGNNSNHCQIEIILSQFAAFSLDRYCFCTNLMWIIFVVEHWIRAA